jgi:CDP-diacylglycerol--glycerol-3-phosphate 3-phosphatidyltransferase
MTKNDFNFQRMADSAIDKTFLRFIPKSVKPNTITVIRFILVPFVYLLLRAHQFDWALIIFVIAVCTDFIDGAMARTRDQITDTGKIIDPIADKLLILSVLLFIGFKFLIVRVFVIFIIFELFAVLLGNWFSFAIGKPMGANVFGKIKLALQAVGAGLFMLGALTLNSLMVRIAGYILVVALVFAVAAGLETVRRKALYLKENKIVYSQPTK